MCTSLYTCGWCGGLRFEAVGRSLAKSTGGRSKCLSSKVGSQDELASILVLVLAMPTFSGWAYLQNKIIILLMCTLKIKHIHLILPATIGTGAIAFRVMPTNYFVLHLCSCFFAAIVSFRVIIWHLFELIVLFSQQMETQAESFLGNQQNDNRKQKQQSVGTRT